MPNMITNGNGCGKKESTLKLKKIRVFTKASTSRQNTINDIYKYEVKSKMVMMRIFRHVLTAVVAAQGAANEFKVKKTDFAAVLKEFRDDFTKMRDMKKQIYDLAEAYLKEFGATKCTGTDN